MTSMDLAPYRTKRAEWKSTLVVVAHITFVLAGVYLAAVVTARESC